MGVRYLWPGELGKMVPRRQTIVVADFQHRWAPPLSQRHIRSLGYNDRLQVGLDRLGFTREDYQRFRAEAQRTQREFPDWFAWLGTLPILAGARTACGHGWAGNHPGSSEK